MLRVRILDREEQNSGKTEFHVVSYTEEIFYKLLEGGFERDRLPFRDGYSSRLIREVDHAELVEGDWYSVVTPFGRTCMTALSSGTKYGLTLLANSAKGIYTSYRAVGNNVWEILGQLPVDILIGLPVEEPLDMYPIQDVGVVYMENYPYEGRRVDCIYSKNYRNFSLLSTDWKNGRLYVNYLWQANMLPRYHWTKDIDGVLRYLEGLRLEEKKVLIETFQICTSREFDALPQLEFDDSLPDDVTIKNHLPWKPDAMKDYENCIYLIVGRRQDGSYVVGDCVSLYHVDFELAFWEAWKLLTDEQAEGMVLIVKLTDKPCSVEFLSDVYFGMKQTGDQMELFEKTEALIEFKSFLKEAQMSGNCSSML